MLIIMAVILLGFNFKVHAELVIEPNGRVRVPTDEFNQNGVRTWRYLDPQLRWPVLTPRQRSKFSRLG